MITGKQFWKKVKNGILYLIAFAVFLTSVPAVSVQATENTAVESETETSAEMVTSTEVTEKNREYTVQELYEIDGGDAEYWKHYDVEGNPVQREDEETAAKSTRSVSGSSLVSPYVIDENGSAKTYTVLSGYDISHGIDVSKYQTDVDWDAVKANGIDTVIIRCAYRGYGTEGTLVDDSAFATHVEGALAAGLHVGTYIYSQAITEEEGREEAQKCLDLCQNYLDQMDMPIVMDVEYANDPTTWELTGRLYNADLSKSEQTAICQAFAKVISDAGYQPMIYANASYLADQMNSSVLTDEGDQIWLAHYTTATSYSASPYVMWQYSYNGSVAGISGDVDMSFIFSQSQDDTTSEVTELDVPALESAFSVAYNSIKVSWGKVAGADGYRLYRKESGGSWKKLTDTTDLTYTDTTAETGTTYYYTVRAYCTVNGSTIWSSYVKEGISGTAELDVPALKNASSTAYNSIKVSWRAVDGASGYRVYRKVSGGRWSILADKLTALTYTDKTAVTGTTYYYTVRAYRTVSGASIWSSYVKAGISGKAIPSTPALVSAVSKGYNKIQFSWKKVAGASGYRVYRKVSGGSWLYLGDAGASTLSYTDEWITTGKTYYYTVRAYRTVNGTKVWGNYNTTGISGKAIPSTPTLTSAVSQGYNSIKVTWGKVAGANGYRVYRKVAGGSWKTVANSVTGLTYTDKTAATGTTYYYTVRAYRTVNGSKVWSSYVKAGISGKAIPSTPSFKLSSTSKGKVKITWNKVSGATGYIVYRKSLSTGKWEKIKTITSGSTLSYTAAGTSGKKVYYTVKAYRTVSGMKVYSKYKTGVGITVK